MKSLQLLMLASLLVFLVLASSTITSHANRLQANTRRQQKPQQQVSAPVKRQTRDDDYSEGDLADDNEYRGGSSTISWIKDCLRTHNKYRKLHGAPPLIFSRKIARFSQKRANLIAGSDGSEFRHPPDLPYGENLAWDSRAGSSCRDLVRMWYDEIRMYSFNNQGFTHGTGHFTQMVWHNTRHIGCARGNGFKGGVTLVCNYDPPGNVIGAFNENVNVPIGSEFASSRGDSNNNQKRKKNQNTGGSQGTQTWSTPFRNPVTSIIGSFLGGGSSRSALDDDDDMGVTKPYKKPFRAFTENPFLVSSVGPQFNQTSGREGRSFNFGPRNIGGFSVGPSVAPSLPVTKSYLTRSSSITTSVSNSTTTTTTTTTSYTPNEPRMLIMKAKKKKVNSNNKKKTKKAPKSDKPKPALSPQQSTSVRPKLSDAIGGVTSQKSATTTTSTTKKPAASEPDSKPSSTSNGRENDQLRRRNLVTDKDKSFANSTSSTAKPRARKRRRRAKNHNNSTSGRSMPSNVSSVRPADSKLQLTSLVTNSSTSTTTTTKRPSGSSSG